MSEEYDPHLRELLINSEPAPEVIEETRAESFRPGFRVITTTTGEQIPDGSRLAFVNDCLMVVRPGMNPLFYNSESESLEVLKFQPIE